MKPIKIKTENGQRTALVVKTGHKFIHVMMMDFPIRVTKLPLSAERYFSELEYKGKAYPLARAKRHFRHAVKTCYGSLRHAPKNVREALA